MFNRQIYDGYLMEGSGGEEEYVQCREYVI